MAHGDSLRTYYSMTVHDSMSVSNVLPVLRLRLAVRAKHPGGPERRGEVSNAPACVQFNWTRSHTCLIPGPKLDGCDSEFQNKIKIRLWFRISVPVAQRRAGKHWSSHPFIRKQLPRFT